MALKLRAEYTNGSLKPLEPLELPEGTVVVIYIEEERTKSKERHSVLDIAERIHQSAPEEIWYNLPDDGAQNVKHYLYGHPKEEN